MKIEWNEDRRKGAFVSEFKDRQFDIHLCLKCRNFRPEKGTKNCMISQYTGNLSFLVGSVVVHSCKLFLPKKIQE